MSTALGASVLFALLVLGFTAVSAALGRRLVTAPLAFVAMGAVLGFAIGPMDGSATEFVKLVAEITLVLILFHDAAQVRPREIGSDGGFYARLLLIGFPLTILLGYLIARLLFPDLSVVMALLLAAALATIDKMAMDIDKKGFAALRRGRLNINALMTVAVSGAFVIGQWPEAAMVMALYAVAELI